MLISKLSTSLTEKMQRALN